MVRHQVQGDSTNTLPIDQICHERKRTIWHNQQIKSDIRQTTEGCMKLSWLCSRNVKESKNVKHGHRFFVMNKYIRALQTPLLKTPSPVHQ